VRVARYWCPKARLTISLLPDFLSSRLSGTLAELEQVVEVAEEAPSRERAVAKLRPAEVEAAVTLPSALRWLRRRLSAVRAALLAAVTLVPSLAECAPTVSAVRERLGAPEALRALRSVASAYLSAMPAPVGFAARVRKRRGTWNARPHEVGPDPP
jgi:hypothetical protein